MYLVRMLFWMHFIAAVLVPFYTEWGRINFSRILFLNAWFMFCVFLLEIPTGTIADFFGRKRSMIIGCGVGIIGALVYISYPNYMVFLVAEMIFAISYTLLSGADEAFIYDTLKEIGRTEISKKIFSRMESFKLSGIIAGAFSGGFIAKYYGLRAPLLLQTIPLGLGVLVALTFKEPLISEKKKNIPYRKILYEGVQYFFQDKILKVLTLDMVVVSTFAMLIVWFYQPLLMNVGVDIAFFGIVHSMMCLAQILIISNFLRLEKLLGVKKRLLFFSASITGVFFLLLGFTRSLPLVITGIILAAGFGLSRGPLFSSYMNKYIPSDKRATILSVTSMLRTFAMVVTFPLAGLLADWSIPNTLIIAGSVIIVFSLISKVKEEHLID